MNTANTTVKNFSNPNEAAKINAITSASAKDVATANSNAVKTAPATQSNQATKTTTPVKTPSNNTNNNAAAQAKAAQASQSNKSSGSSPVYSSTGSTYYDIDTALASVYDQAKAAGIAVSKPSSYGKSISNQDQAQKNHK